MSGQAQSAYRKVIVGLCHGAADAATMRTAAEFAQLLGLDLHCLFIEDEALLALAELPFAREIRLPTHTWSPLTADAVEADIRQAVIRTRRLLDEIIQEIGVPTEFEVLRGDPATCIAAVCQSGDIIVSAEHGPPTFPVTHSVTRLHAGAHESATSVLLLPTHLKPRRGPVVAVLTDAADHSLDMACRVATSAKEDLVILLPEPAGSRAADTAAAGAKNRAHALGQPQEHISVRTIHGFQAEDVLRALAHLQERLIVMTRATSAATAASRIAAARGVPVLLFEPEAPAAQATARKSRRKASTIAESGSVGSSANS